jgi:hypothetical protein
MSRFHSIQFDGISSAIEGNQAVSSGDAAWSMKLIPLISLVPVAISGERKIHIFEKTSVGHPGTYIPTPAPLRLYYTLKVNVTLMPRNNSCGYSG